MAKNDIRSACDSIYNRESASLCAREMENKTGKPHQAFALGVYTPDTGDITYYGVEDSSKWCKPGALFDDLLRDNERDALECIDSLHNLEKGSHYKIVLHERHIILRNSYQVVKE